MRESEFTIGPNGLSAMPAGLPAGVAYTYCLDLSLDEADELAGQLGVPSLDTRFTKPVTMYVKDFLKLPVGSAVPNGYYDLSAGLWKADTDAVVIKIIGFAADTAIIDADGSGTASAQSRLNALGIDTAERIQLHTQFANGDTLVRTLLSHFSDRDLNEPQGPTPTPVSLGTGLLQRIGSLFGCVTAELGSIIECESRVLGESIPITGTSMSLNYRSFRAPGDKAVRTVKIPLVGDTLQTGLLSIATTMDVAGKRYTSLDSHPSPHDSVMITWDGTDAYGRLVDGSATAHVSIGFQFAPTVTTGNGKASYNNSANSGTQTWAPSGERYVPHTSWSHLTITLGAPSAVTDGLGGWTITPHHFYDVNGYGALYRGDGSVDLGEEQPPVMTRPLNGMTAHDVAVAPNGTIYYSDETTHSIYLVPPGGAAVRYAGMGSAGRYSDNVPATNTHLRNPKSLVLGPDGSLYFAMDVPPGTHQHDADSCARVCKVTPDGLVHVVAGNGATSNYGSGDGGPAAEAVLAEPVSLAVAPDGSVFIGDKGALDYTVRRVGPDGIITTYAGVPGSFSHGGSSDSTGRATSIWLGGVDALAVEGGGTLYIGEANRLRQVTPSGLMSSVIPAINGANFFPEDMSFGPDGALYIVSAGTPRIYRRDPDGTMTVVAGAGVQSSAASVPGGFANANIIFSPEGIDVGPDGAIYFCEQGNLTQGIRKIARPFPSKPTGIFTVRSTDGSEVYAFDQYGRHLWTRDYLTGGVKYLFNYGSNGQLAAVYDANGDSTKINRDGSGNISIVAPYGQTTNLQLNANYLHTVQDPASEIITLGTDSNGLLTSFQDAKGQTHSFAYNATDGRLSSDTDPAGGSQTLAGQTALNRIEVSRQTSLGRTTKYDVTSFYDGAQQRSVTRPDGFAVSWSDSSNGSARGEFPDGTVTGDSLQPFNLSLVGLGTTNLGRYRTSTPGGLKRIVDVLASQNVNGNGSSDAGFGTPAPAGTYTSSIKTNFSAPLLSTFTITQSPSLRWLRHVSLMVRVDSMVVDSVGRPTSLTTYGITSSADWTYDGHGRLTDITQGVRNLHFAYDSYGRVDTLRDALARSTYLAYDAANRVTSTTLPAGSHIQFGYDANGNVTSITPPGGWAHSFAYSGVDQVLQYTPPTVSDVPSPATTYTYDNDHQLTGVTRPDGALVSLAYDATKGRLNSVTVARGQVGIGYSSSTGQVSSLSSPDTVTVSLGYDGPLLTSEAWSGKTPGGATVTVGHSFNSWFWDSTVTVGGTTIAFSHDLDGLVTAAGALSIHHRADNRLVDSTQAGNLISSQDYDDAGALANLSYKSGGTEIFSQSIARDPLGRITEIMENDFGTTGDLKYRYDLAGRLYGVTLAGDTVATYAYDGNGNRIAVNTPSATDSAVYDAQDRLLSFGHQSAGYTRYTYTAAGERRTVTSGSNVTRLEYDPLGNLVRDTLSGGDIIQYSADGEGRRVGRRLNGSWTGGWVYQNALNVVGELDGSGNVIRTYVYGLEPHVPALMLDGSATYRLITDQLGSVRAVVNANTGEVVQRRDYDAWGVVTYSSGSNTQALGFAGGLTDVSTGLVRFGARDYDPVAGRWTAKDPVGFGGGGTNLMAYADSDPANQIDPDGGEVILAAIGAVVGGAANAVSNYHALETGQITEGQYAKAIAFGAGAGALSGLLPGVGGVIAGAVLAGANEANNEASLVNATSINGANVATAAAFAAFAGSLVSVGEGVGSDIGYFAKDKVGNLVFRDLRTAGGGRGFRSWYTH